MISMKKNYFGIFCFYFFSGIVHIGKSVNMLVMELFYV